MRKNHLREAGKPDFDLDSDPQVYYAESWYRTEGGRLLDQGKYHEI